MLQYAAATALFQQVALLERYVLFATQKHGYKAYVVRMNVGVQPFARGQPYDVYSSIGFFKSHQECDSYTTKKQPYILPLLVTDNLEGITTARSAEMVTQIALAVTVLAQGLAGDASFGYTRDRLKSVLGTDLNSLLTVSRSADNVIQARLGAASQPTTRFAMIPRNHTIAALMLVPREMFTDCTAHPPRIRLVMRSVLREATTGVRLPYHEGGLLEAMKLDLSELNLEEEDRKKLLAPGTNYLFQLMTYVQEQDRDKFDALIVEKLGLRTYRDGLWLLLAEARSRSPIQYTTVTLCDPAPHYPNPGFKCEKVSEPQARQNKTPDPTDKNKTTASGTTIYTTIQTTTTPPAK